MYNELYEKEEEIKQYIIDNLDAYIDTPLDELHYYLFNADYYLIYTHDCKEWLNDFVFDAVEAIRDYEEANFGEVSTDFSDPCKVVNMYTYILGEQILNSLNTFIDNHDEPLTDKLAQAMIKELEGE